MSHKSKRSVSRQIPRNITVRAVQRDQPDLHRLARAVLALAKERQAERDKLKDQAS